MKGEIRMFLAEIFPFCPRLAGYEGMRLDKGT